MINMIVFSIYILIICLLSQGFANSESESEVYVGYKVPFFGKKTPITEILGQGAFGAVGTIKADPFVVVKVVPANHPHEVKEIHLEEDMFSLMSDLPVVPKIVDLTFGTRPSSQSKEAYLFVERCPSDILKEIKKNETPPLKQVQAWLFDLAFALQAFHKRGYAHNDVKPGNLLLSYDNVAKLSDYGLSHQYQRNEQLQGFRGTFQYSSPEKVHSWLHRYITTLQKKKDLDSTEKKFLKTNRSLLPIWTAPPKNTFHWDGQTSDVWGLASVFYMICTKKPLGVRIKKNNNTTRVDMGLLTEDDIMYQLDSTLPLNTCGPLLPLFKKMLRFDPKKRITMAEVQKELLRMDSAVLANRPWSMCNIECEPGENGIRKIHHGQETGDRDGEGENLVSFLFCWSGERYNGERGVDGRRLYEGVDWKRRNLPDIPWLRDENFLQLSGFEAESDKDVSAMNAAAVNRGEKDGKSDGGTKKAADKPATREAPVKREAPKKDPPVRAETTATREGVVKREGPKESSAKRSSRSASDNSGKRESTSRDKKAQKEKEATIPKDPETPTRQRESSGSRDRESPVPKSRDSTPREREATTRERDATSRERDTTSRDRDNSPSRSRDNSPSRERQIPVSRERDAPTSRDRSPSPRERDAPVTRERTSQSREREASPSRERTPSPREREVPVSREREVPVSREREAPVSRERVSTSREKDPPVNREREVPVSRERSPPREREASPVTRDRAPATTRERTPASRERSPSREREAPVSREREVPVSREREPRIVDPLAGATRVHPSRRSHSTPAPTYYDGDIQALEVQGMGDIQEGNNEVIHNGIWEGREVGEVHRERREDNERRNTKLRGRRQGIDPDTRERHSAPVSYSPTATKERSENDGFFFNMKTKIQKWMADAKSAVDKIPISSPNSKSEI